MKMRLELISKKLKNVPNKLIVKFLHTNINDPIIQTEEWTKFESYGKMVGTGIPPCDDYRRENFITSYVLDGCVVTVCTRKESNQALEFVFI